MLTSIVFDGSALPRFLAVATYLGVLLAMRPAWAAALLVSRVAAARPTQAATQSLTLRSPCGDILFQLVFLMVLLRLAWPVTNANLQRWRLKLPGVSCSKVRASFWQTLRGQ